MTKKRAHLNILVHTCLLNSFSVFIVNWKKKTISLNKTEADCVLNTESPKCPITTIPKGFIHKELKGEGKEQIQHACFLNGGFQKYGHAFLQRQWPRSSPLRSPCSSPSLFAISLSPSEQKHTAHPARNNTPSQKFTSCASAPLLHADPIPKTCKASRWPPPCPTRRN